LELSPGVAQAQAGAMEAHPEVDEKAFQNLRNLF
jgi:hypothetical protein